jgi:hypothetical protein
MFAALPYVTSAVFVTAVKISSRYRSGAAPSGYRSGQQPLVNSAISATAPTNPYRFMGTWSTVRGMCRNITGLRGLEPEATPEEIHAAALQYVRKVGGISKVTPKLEAAVERAVAKIAAATTELLEDLPERKVPPKTLPPLRRLAATAAAAGPVTASSIRSRTS